MNKKLPGLVALALILIGSTGVYAYQKPVSFVSLDINPSIELGVNVFDVVVSAEGYNTDGETVLKDLEVEGESLEDAVNEIIDAAILEGYVLEDGSSVISITTETDDKELSEELVEAAEEGVENALEENETEAEVEKDNIALERRDEARELGITPGKLNLIQKLQAVNPEAKIEDFKDESVKEIMRATHEAKGIGQGKKDKVKEEEVEPVTEDPVTEEPVADVPVETTDAAEVVDQDETEIEASEPTEIEDEKSVIEEETPKVKPVKEKPEKPEPKVKSNNGKSKGN